jgi:hypothetical protein
MPKAKRGFVLRPRRWVVERSIAMKQVLVKASREVVIQR